MFASKKRVKEVTAEEALLPQANMLPQMGAQSAVGGPAVGTNVNQAKLLIAKQMASKINKNLEKEKQVRLSDDNISWRWVLLL